MALTKNYFAFIRQRWRDLGVEAEKVRLWPDVSAIELLQARVAYRIVRELFDQGEPVGLEFYGGPSAILARSPDIMLIREDGLIYSVDFLARDEPVTDDQERVHPAWMPSAVMPDPGDWREPYTLAELGWQDDPSPPSPPPPPAPPPDVLARVLRLEGEMASARLRLRALEEAEPDGVSRYTFPASVGRRWGHTHGVTVTPTRR